MACSCNKAMNLGDSSEPQRYPEFPATSFDPMGTYEPPVRMDSMDRKFFGYGTGGAPIYVENVSLQDSSEPDRYPQFPATARKFFGYGTGGAPIYVENVSAKATKFIGYEKDGSPIYVENLSAKAYVGNRKDGSPVFINASDPYAINWGNVVATGLLATAGVALGWLVAKSTLSYLK